LGVIDLNGTQTFVKIVAYNPMSNN
jgi:hypothetical protein